MRIVIEIDAPAEMTPGIKEAVCMAMLEQAALVEQSAAGASIIKAGP